MYFAGKTVVIVSVSTTEGFSPNSRESTPHIGEACARDFARHGAHVIAIDNNRAALDALGVRVRAEGGSISLVEADPGDAASLKRAADASQAERNAVDVLVNCHSEMEKASVENSSIDSWVRVINIDLLGPLFASKAFLPLLKRATGAAIIHVGSIDGTLGNPQIPSYSAAKGGLVPLTHIMAEEFSRYGIRVNCVARAMFSERGVAVDPRFAPLIAQTPIARPAYPDEVAAVIRFLASAEASYVNGVVLPVDGGRSVITPGTRVRF